MKKLFSIILIFALSAALLTSCSTSSYDEFVLNEKNTVDYCKRCGLDELVTEEQAEVIDIALSFCSRHYQEGINVLHDEDDNIVFVDYLGDSYLLDTNTSFESFWNTLEQYFTPEAAQEEFGDFYYDYNGRLIASNAEGPFMVFAENPEIKSSSDEEVVIVFNVEGVAPFTWEMTLTNTEDGWKVSEML